MKDILNHRSTDKPMNPEDDFEGDPTKCKHKKTTEGKVLLVQWADKTQPQLWITLNYLKESYPIQVADYTKANGTSGKPEFLWWVPYTPKKRINMISQVKSRYWKWTHKYGIEIPNTYKQAVQLDDNNGTNLWRLDWQKDMQNVQVALI